MIKQLEFFQKAAEKLAQQISKEMEVLVHEDFTAENFLLIMDKMFANFQDCIDEYKRETKK
jgi:aminoglycoside/choline kinase family phosphotransferase